MIREWAFDSGSPMTTRHDASSMLPSGMHTPWAESVRYKDFGAQYRSQPDGHARSVHPRIRSVYASTNDFGYVPYTLAATLDTGPLAKSYPGGSPTRLSSNHFQSARSSDCSACIALTHPEHRHPTLCLFRAALVESELLRFRSVLLGKPGRKIVERFNSGGTSDKRGLRIGSLSHLSIADIPG